MNKQEFVYPGSDFDRGKTLLSLLGTFWSMTYSASDQMASYVKVVGETANQTYRNLLEVVAGVSRHDVPVLHTELLVPITLKKSECNTALTSIARFDSGSAVIDGTLQFDRPQQTTIFSFPLPDNLVDVANIFNRIAFPTTALTKNSDYVIDRGRHAIVFAADPFENSTFARRVYQNGAQLDEELTVWGFMGGFDYDYVFEQFAYAIGLKLRSSQGYKDLTNAIITGLIDGGLTAKTLDAALTAICGVPVVANNEETVEVMQYDHHGLFIATDKAVYRFSSSATPSVAIGQVMRAGDYLIRGFDVSEFYINNSYIAADESQQVVCQAAPMGILETQTKTPLLTEDDQVITLSDGTTVCRRLPRDITALALDNGFLAACFYGDLVFENKNVPLEVNTEHPSGYTYVKFGVGGLPADVEFFFDEIHRRGVDYAELPPNECVPGRKLGTLAQLLDRRPKAQTQPTAADLPTSINPLRFVIENVLRNNVFVVRIFVPALGQNRLGLYNVRQLRAMIPPQTAMIVVFELVADSDIIDAVNNIAETVQTFTGMEPVADIVGAELVRDIGVTARLVSGTCQ